MTNQDFTFYTSTDYWRALQAQYAQAGRGDRIAMMVMSFEPSEPIVQQVLQGLMGAADRGADVHLVVDAYNFLIHPASQTLGPLWWHGTTLERVPRSYRYILQALQALDGKPTARVTIINTPPRPFTNPKGGRSHIKFTIINNRVFVGGCNLHSTTWLDGMVSWRDPRTANSLFTFVLDLEKGKSTQALMRGKDRTISLDDRTTLCIDAGKKRQSIIFDKALELIDNAEKSVLITCQFFPNGITAKHLAAARRRGVQVQIVYAHPSKHGMVGGLLQHGNELRERLRVPAELFRDRLPKTGPGIHAKIIATEKGGIIGSNNYVYAGVLFGTAEMAVLRHDPAFGQSLGDLVGNLLQGTPLKLRR